VSTDSQRAEIGRYLKSGKSLTALEALHKFGCWRLGARIWELKKQGVPVQSYTATVGRGKKAKRVSAYFVCRAA